ncbi:response regulator transcription factor, partial [Prosthecobacter sp.]|uniref:response regulator transcription factor n=1 Tax=Prosthecobacter sp. TaxID=1965333 RepID=UPI002ABBC895
MSKILIVEDESDIAELIALHLEREGHEAVCIANGLQALPAALEHSPALIVLDLMLPGLDGVQIFKRLRADTRTATIPVIILTAKAQVTDKIAGLELGADDYLTKPFGAQELLARVRAVLRRGGANVVAPKEAEALAFGPFRLDVNSHVLLHDGAEIPLTSGEFTLL